MTVTLKFYADSSLTTEINALNPLAADFLTATGGSTDKIIFLGSTAPGKTFRDTVAPGTAQIVVSVVDANAGTGQAATSIKLATTAGGLGSAVAGAPVNVGTSIASGVGNAAPIYMRVTPSSLVAGTYLDLSLTTSQVQES